MQLGSKKGFECEEHPDGSKTCKRYKIKKSGAYATGTDVELIPDSQTCKVRVVGRINDEDKSSISEEIKKMEGSCKKGF